MRVAHLVDRLDTIGGVQTYIEALVPALAERDIDSVLLTGADGPIAIDADRHVVVGLDTDGARFADATAEALRHALATLDVDVCIVHLNVPEAVEIASSLLRTDVYVHDYAPVCPGGARYLHRSQTFCVEGVGARCFWRAYTERSTNRRPDRLLLAYKRTRAWENAWSHARRVMVASPFVAEVLSRDGVPREMIRVVGYPVAAFEAPDVIEPNDVLFVGRLVASKGVQVLLEALAEIPEARAVIAGDGPARASLEGLAAKLGLASRVTFLGWIDPTRRASLLAGARVFVLPSLWDEPFGIVGVEALSAGVPVVASDVGGVSSWLEDGVSGLLAPRGNARDLAKQIRRMRDDRSRAPFAAAAPVAGARFSPERHVERLLGALES
jgi:glycosyltransferase involved in cell wall biosynthesis